MRRSSHQRHRGVATLERRHKPSARNARSGVNNKDAAEKVESASGSWQLLHIAELIKGGEITVGALNPVGCIAVASDEDTTWAMLLHRKAETVTPLLTRLDLAIAKAHNEDIFTDGINPSPTISKRS